MKKVIIIAEAGPNHNGKLKRAYQLVDAAKKSGADFIKFQTAIPELHISKFAQKAKYQKNSLHNIKNQLELSKKIILSYKEFIKLKKYCKKKKLNFYLHHST